MLPVTFSYKIFPSVVPMDRKVKMTVLSAERAFLFKDGDEYTVNIISVNTDENYYSPQGKKRIKAVASGGYITFEHIFLDEGEYTLELICEEKAVGKFTVYSLKEDIYSLLPLKGDLHSHSCRSDGTRDPASQAGHYREQGYDFVALTDHNRYYPGGEIDEAYAGVDTGLLRVLGEEVHTPGSVVHIVHVGGKRSVADRYVHDRERYDSEIEEYIKKVPEDIPEDFKTRYAKAMWATDEIHSAGGIAIFPHPFWRPGSSKTYNVKSEYANILLKSGMFDAYELVGAMTQPDINLSLALWSDIRAMGYAIPAVGSSDTHALERASTFPHYFIVCFATEKTNDAVIDAVRQGACVAVEAVGTEYERQYRCYGAFRLVAYAQFLLANYFPELQRLTASAGAAMRSYAMGDISPVAINALTEAANLYTARFFGRAEPALPTEELLNFEEKWREVHKNGPKTRGSAV